MKEIIENKNDIVLSLGGGTPCYGENMKLVNENPKVISIYLKSTIPTLVERLKSEKSKRPLVAHLGTDQELTEFIGKHLFERSPFYQQAQAIIDTDNKTLKIVEEEIILSLF